MGNFNSTLALVALALTLAFGAARAESIPEHAVNKAFDPSKGTIVDEPEVETTAAEKRWAAATAATPAQCQGVVTWRTKPKGKVAVTAFKSKTVPVAGQFTRFVATLVSSDSDGKTTGNGAIQATSWDSKDVARDRRVQRYVLAAEEESTAIIPFQLSLGKWTPKSHATWQTDAAIVFALRGKEIRVSLPVKARRKGDSLFLQSTKPARFTYASPGIMSSIQRLMERCNHESIATFVDLQIDVELESACAKK